jgi:hypothetical protein
VPRGPRDAGGGVSPCWLEQNLVGGELRKLGAYFVGIPLIGHDEYVGVRNEVAYAVVAHLQERAAGAEEVDKLLGQSRAAVRPESASDASAHYHAVAVLFFIHVGKQCFGVIP